MRARMFSISLANTCRTKTARHGDGEGRRNRGEKERSRSSRVRETLTRGYQVQNAFPTLKVEFNCWRKFRGEGRIHMLPAYAGLPRPSLQERRNEYPAISKRNGSDVAWIIIVRHYSTAMFPRSCILSKDCVIYLRSLRKIGTLIVIIEELIFEHCIAL